MKLLHESHQLHFVADNSDVNVTPHLMSSLLNHLGKFNLMPTFGNMLNPMSGEKRQFIIMVSPDERLRVELPVDRILIAMEGVDSASFVKTAFSIIDSLQDIFPTKFAMRLSLLTARVYDGTEEEYKSLYESLFTYRGVSPIEWDNRIVERKTIENDETLNVISTIRRCKFALPRINGGSISDGIMSELDINTIAESKELRFSLSASKDFFNELSKQQIAASDLLKRYFP